MNFLVVWLTYFFAALGKLKIGPAAIKGTRMVIAALHEAGGHDSLEIRLSPARLIHYCPRRPLADPA